MVRVRIAQHEEVCSRQAIEEPSVVMAVVVGGDHAVGHQGERRMMSA
jgi:hypothetical protein